MLIIGRGLKGNFPESEELIGIINSLGWGLWNTSKTGGKNPKIMKWDEIEKQGPARILAVRNNYIFAPLPENGQSLRDAYSVTKGLGPALTIRDINEDRWATLYVTNWRPLKEEYGVPITRLVFEPELAFATTPATRDMPDPDVVGMNYPFLLDTFRSSFRIIQPHEYGHRNLPIPMPFHPEDN